MASIATAGPQGTEEQARRLHERMMNVARFATLGEMAVGVAHEINQPLSAIANYARACEHFLAAGEPDLAEVRQALREIGSEALRAGDIIRRLRGIVARRESERTDTEINALIHELQVLLEADARLHGTRLRFELAAGLPRASVDRMQIQHLLLNLLRNALEALADLPAGSREVTIRTSPASNGDIEVSVSDNGPGVAPEIAERMFEPFSTTKDSGTGLGLAVSRTIAQDHGGAIGHRAASPAGACFWVRIPRAEAAGS